MAVSYLLEACVDSVESALAAEAAGAARIELCSNLTEGGCTPSSGCLELVRESLNIPVFAMVRPRGGDFCYSKHELAVMKRDIEHFRQLGVDGIVSGVLLSNHDIDAHRTLELREIARPLPFTFHRAFDLTPDARQALELLVELGCKRILTAGQAPTAHSGMLSLRSLQALAAGRISIVAAGGIRADHVRQLLETTGITEFHVNATEIAFAGETEIDRGIRFGQPLPPGECYRRIASADRIAACMRELR